MGHDRSVERALSGFGEGVLPCRAATHTRLPERAELVPAPCHPAQTVYPAGAGGAS